jgi:hypothetical protein
LQGKAAAEIQNGTVGFFEACLFLPLNALGVQHAHYHVQSN